MFKRIQIYLKKKHPNLYNKLRSYLFRYVSQYRKKKILQFTNRQTVDIKYAGFQFKIVIDPKNGFVDQTIFANKVYEPDILSVIKQHLYPGDTFVDIGANIGQHSLFAACVVGKSGKVVSSEPLPSIAAQFSESIILNDFGNIVDIYNYGCSNKTESVPIYVNPINVGGSSIHTEAHTTTITETIDLVPSDHILEKYSRVDFIKIDTEGHECEVLEGLQETILRHSPKILLEFSPIFRKDITGYDILAPLDERGYTFYDLENGHSKINDLRGWVANFNKIQTNLLCLPAKKIR